MSRRISNKLIAIIFSLVVLFGLIPQLFPFFSFLPSRIDGHFQSQLYYFLGAVNLDFIRFSLFEYYNSETNLTCNFINVVFYSFALVGFIVFIKSKYKETRIIRFVFSVLLITHVVRILLGFILTGFHAIHEPESVIPWGLWALNISLSFIWVAISYLILYKIKSEKKIIHSVFEAEGWEREKNVLATNWQRLFHHIIDIYLCFFLFANYTHLFGEKIINSIYELAGQRGVILLLLIVYRTIYYPFFEYILGATPAKLLTETRVVSQQDEKVGFLTILGRTFSRFVPFEPFSFLANYGWHDKWTNTKVVKEVRSGVKGQKYFLIIPLFIVGGLLWYGGFEWNENRKDYNEAKLRYKNKIKTFERQLNNLTTNDFIKLDELTYSNSSYTIFLKLEEKGKDTWLFRKAKIENKYSYEWFEVEQQFSKYEYTYDLVELRLSDLLQAFTKDYDVYKKYNRSGRRLFNDDREFEIEEIVQRYGPILTIGGSGMSGESNIYLGIKNEGWPVDLIAFENIIGDTEWDNKVPVRINASTYGSSYSFSSSNYIRGSKYKFRFVLQDTLHNKHVYEIEGANLNRTLLKVE